MGLPLVCHMPPYRAPAGAVPDAALIDGVILEDNDANNVVAFWAETRTPIAVPRTPYEIWIDNAGSEIALCISSNTNPYKVNAEYGNAERDDRQRRGWRRLMSFITDGRDEWTVATKGACEADEAAIAAFKADGRRRSSMRRVRVVDIAKDTADRIGSKIAEVNATSMAQFGAQVASQIAKEMRGHFDDAPSAEAEPTAEPTAEQVARRGRRS